MDEAFKVVLGPIILTQAMDFARECAPAPLGMRGRGLFLNVDDPVSLHPIPQTRAIKIGKHWWDANTIHNILHRNGDATNPLTRQPFSEQVKKWSKAARQHWVPHHVTRDLFTVLADAAVIGSLNVALGRVSGNTFSDLENERMGQVGSLNTLTVYSQNYSVSSLADGANGLHVL